MQDLFDELEKTATRIPGSVAFASGAGFMNYQTLLGNISSAAWALARNDLSPGQLVVISRTGHPDTHVVIALALMRLGCRVGFTMDLGLYESSGIAIDAVIAHAPIPGTKHRVITIGRDWFKGADALDLKLPQPSADYSMIFASSGSTGEPKLIEYEREALLYRVSARVSDAPFGNRPRFLSSLGTRTAAHFFNAFPVVLAGGMIIGPSDRSGRTVLDSIQLFQPHYVLMSPSTMAEILRYLDETPMEFDKVRLLKAPGARSSPELQRAMLDKLTDEFMSFYGSTETGGIAWGSSQDVLKIDGCVGRVSDALDAAAFSADGQALSPGLEGEIRVKSRGGPFAKYIGKDAHNQPGFVDGWFATGDIGIVDEDRNLIIRGRASNVINIGGTKVSPERVEEEIRAFSQVRDVGVVGLDSRDGFDQIGAAIVSSSKLSVDDINAHLQRRRASWPVHVVKSVAAIPKTDSGKIDRVALGRLFTESD